MSNSFGSGANARAVTTSGLVGESADKVFHTFAMDCRRKPQLVCRGL